MAGEGSSSTFKDSRATLRDTAKWMTSGIFGIAALIVGSTTISQIGSMDPTTCRFRIAVGCLVVATGLCWIPFIKAVDVLRSDVLSLGQFATAGKGELNDAANAVEVILGETLPGEQPAQLVSMRAFSEAFYRIRRAAWDAAPDDKGASEKAVAYIDDFRDTCRDACVTELVAVRFDKLITAIGLAGPAILLLFLIATWAANPAKDDSALAEKPYLEDLKPAQIASLTSGQIPPACLGTGARLVVLSTPEARLQTMVLVPPEKAASTCVPHKLIQADGKIVKIDK